MANHDATRITELLQGASEDEGSFDRIAEAVYQELERVASQQMFRHYGKLDGLTLEPTALVHETLLKLMQRPREYENRRHFYAFATKVMVRVMLDYQRRRSAGKRGGDQVKVTLSGLGSWGRESTAIEIAQLLEELSRLDPRKAEVVQLKVFWGLEMKEIAETLQVSLASIERDWRFARSWLASHLRP